MIKFLVIYSNLYHVPKARGSGCLPHRLQRYEEKLKVVSFTCCFLLVVCKNTNNVNAEIFLCPFLCMSRNYFVFLHNVYLKLSIMETTLVLLKPGCVQRQLIGEVINRFERRGLRISGMKMMQLSDEILREHYAHLVEKPFFPGLQASMQASPVIAMALTGVEAVKVVRQMAGPTNGREAAPGTIRGDYSMSNQQNIVHASDSVENAAIEVRRFFRPEEVFDYTAHSQCYVYGEGECK
jgi:nucleoside-diphosphate kinase